MPITIVEELGRTTFIQEDTLLSPEHIDLKSSDQTFFSKILKNDKFALNEIVDRYGDIIWNATKKFALSPVEAEKLTCEVFSDLWENLDKFDINTTNERDFVMMICLKRIMKYQRNIF